MSHPPHMQHLMISTVHPPHMQNLMISSSYQEIVEFSSIYVSWQRNKIESDSFVFTKDSGFKIICSSTYATKSNKCTSKGIVLLLFVIEIGLYMWHYLRSLQSKMKGSDQELIESNPTSQPQNQKETKYTHKLINIHERQAQ